MKQYLLLAAVLASSCATTHQPPHVPTAEKDRNMNHWELFLNTAAVGMGVAIPVLITGIAAVAVLHWLVERNDK